LLATESLRGRQQAGSYKGFRTTFADVNRSFAAIAR
jgi:hypothetical protein